MRNIGLLSNMVLVLLLMTTAIHAQSFIQREGTHLILDGKPFRLLMTGTSVTGGREGYGPHDPSGPRFPLHFEIDDAFATAAEIGRKGPCAPKLPGTLSLVIRLASLRNRQV